MNISKHNRKETSVTLNSPNEDNQNSNLYISLFKHFVRINLPSWLIPAHHINREYYDPKDCIKKTYKDLITRSYGFWYCHDEHFLSIQYGIQDDRNLCDKSQYKQFSYFLPWLDWTYVDTLILYEDGAEYMQLPSNYDYIETIRKHAPSISFKMQDFDGEIINAIAYHEQREWHRGTGWWKWLKYVSKPRICRYAEMIHDEEVGQRKNSWKGGTLSMNIPLGDKLFNMETIKNIYENDRYTNVKILDS